MGVFKRCECCGVFIDGRRKAGYFVSQDGDTFCTARHAERRLGAQEAIEHDEQGEAIDWNWFWTQEDNEPTYDEVVEMLEEELEAVQRTIRTFPEEVEDMEYERGWHDAVKYLLDRIK